MSIDAINEQLLRAIGVGVAILDRDDLSIRFCNQAIGEWFEQARPGARLTDMFPELQIAEVDRALAEAGRYSSEARIKKKRRTLVVALTFTAAEADIVVLECQNITRIRELESMIDSYSAMVERNTRDLQREKERVEKLLLNIMPRTVYEEYKTFGIVTPQVYDPVSVLTLDFIDFTATSGEMAPALVVSEMNDIFTAFDRIGEQFGCERIKTVGDAYVCLAGLPEPIEEHATVMANAALRFVRYLERRNETHPHSWRARIGIASGSVIGSVVGVQRYVYDVFGAAVKLSGKLCEVAQPMEIVCTTDTRAALQGDFSVEERGGTKVAGFGEVPLFRIGRALAGTS